MLLSEIIFPPPNNINKAIFFWQLTNLLECYTKNYHPKKKNLQNRGGFSLKTSWIQKLPIHFLSDILFFRLKNFNYKRLFLMNSTERGTFWKTANTNHWTQKLKNSVSPSWRNINSNNCCTCFQGWACVLF